MKSKTKRGKVSKADFDYFCKRVEFWKKTFGITWYNINCIFGEPWAPPDANGTVMASYGFTEDMGAASVTLNKDFPRRMPRIELDEAAFHEVLELGYFGSLRSMSMGTYCRFEVDRATHQAVRAAEATIFHALRTKRVK